MTDLEQFKTFLLAKIDSYSSGCKEEKLFMEGILLVIDKVELLSKIDKLEEEIKLLKELN